MKKNLLFLTLIFSISNVSRGSVLTLPFNNYETFQSSHEAIKLIDKICNVNFLKNTSFLTKYGIELAVFAGFIGAIIYKKVFTKVEDANKYSTYIIVFKSKEELQNLIKDSFYEKIASIGNLVKIYFDRIKIELAKPTCRKELATNLKLIGIEYSDFFPVTEVDIDIFDLLPDVEDVLMNMPENAKMVGAMQPPISQEVTAPNVAGSTNAAEQNTKIFAFDHLFEDNSVKIKNQNKFKRLTVDFAARHEMFDFKDTLENLNLGKVELVDCNERYFAFLELNKEMDNKEIYELFIKNKIKFIQFKAEFSKENSTEIRYKRIAFLIKDFHQGMHYSAIVQKISSEFNATYVGTSSNLQPPYRTMESNCVLYFDLNENGLTIQEINKLIKEKGFQEHIKLYNEVLFLNWN